MRFPVLLAFAMVIVFAALAAWGWWRVRAAERRLREAARRALRREVRALQAGEFVRLVGRVEALGTPFVAPIGGAPCVYYELFEAGDEQERQDFLLTDATGQVRISVSAAEIVAANAGDAMRPDGEGGIVLQACIPVGGEIAVIGHVVEAAVLDATAGPFREVPRPLYVRAVIVAGDPRQIN